ncbi:MAG: peptidoglycan-binding protein [Acidobacteria bacterium]|nr:peptidoglycan-binding protein [Acidobacteriota bacterium]
MTVSIRIAGKIVHVSNVPSRNPSVDVGSATLLRRVRLDPTAIQALRQLLVGEVGSVVQRLADPLVVDETIKRVTAGRWSLGIVDLPQIKADASLSDMGSSGPRKASDPEKSTKKTWVEIELLDKNKHPVKGLAVELTLPDGTVEKGTLSDKGSFRKDGIDPGTCKVRFPDIDGREWAKSSNFADGAAVTLLKGAPKIAAGPYKVVQGDHIASIAADAGFLSWKTIWDDGKNASLKAKRNPNVLYPGDLLEIPAKQKKEESAPTTEYSTFQTIGDPVQLKIVVLDWAGNPVVDTELDIQLDGSEKIKTAGDGSATKKSVDPQGEKVGKLTVKGFALGLKLGHLDPVEELSGQVWRLNNLGYRAGDAKDASDMNFKSAVEEFQCDNNLTVDGICGAGTQGKLKDVHGS